MASLTNSLRVFNSSVSFTGLNATRVQTWPSGSRWQQISCLFYTGLWISQILTTSCYGPPAVLASLASSEVANLQSIALLILLCIRLVLTYRFTPLWNLKVSECLSSDARQTLSERDASSFWLWLRPSKSWGFLGNYLHFRGPGPGPLFLYQDGTPRSRSKLSAFLKTTLYPPSTVGRCSCKFIWS